MEDLLIEEIIEKSFNNKLGVTDDEGQMARTLLDIKDKLLELSKKNSQIGNYNSQVEEIEKLLTGKHYQSRIVPIWKKYRKKLIMNSI